MYVLPVCGESGQCEHGHPHRGQLDERDQFASDAAEEPLVNQIAAGVHRGAGQQEQHVPQSQAGEEQVGHGAHGLDHQTRLHQGHVPHEAHGDDGTVDGGDADARRPDVVPLLPDHPGDVGRHQPEVPQQVRGERILQRHSSGEWRLTD